ncbi:MAG: hypothetical protein AB1714_22825 [Acidobacteriota bacterium]
MSQASTRVSDHITDACSGVCRRAAEVAALAVLLGPVCALAIGLLDSPGAGPAVFSFGARRLGLLGKSALVAAGVSLGSVAIAVIAATRLARVRGTAAAVLKSLLLVLAAVPPDIHAFAWSTAMLAVTDRLAAIGVSAMLLQGWPAVFAVECMAMLPLTVVVAWVGMDVVEPALVEAARPYAPDQTVFARVALPLAAPILGLAAAVVFLLSLMDYCVPSLFSVNGYAIEVFAQYSADGSPAAAACVALPLVALAAGMMVACVALWRGVASSSPQGGHRVLAHMVWPRWWRALQVACLTIVSLQASAPILVLTLHAGGFSTMANTLIAALPEIRYTAVNAVVAAAMSIPLGAAAGARLAAGGRWSRFWWIAVCIPLALPASLSGIGVISLSRQLPAWAAILAPPVVLVSRFMPLAALLVYGRLRRLDSGLMDAARVHQENGIQTFWLVWRPILSPALRVSAGIVIAFSLCELGASILVAPPGRPPLAVRLYNLLHYGASDQVAALCLALMGAAFIVGTSVTVALRRR